ncbi:ABC transporter permease subunit [Aquipuribacter nitratireducens]|uniref:Amino acid ABC transporter permease n=1 Tax=Aquipuribacter nitratireducens TaxID=650104 RepID=A0ABW0GIS1_9MICO
MSVLVDNIDLFWEGFLRSLEIIVFALVGSLVLGTVLAMMRVSPAPPLQRFGSLYVALVRNSPLTVMLFFTAFVLPALGFNAEFFWLGVLGLSLYTAGFVCEAIRSGINAVPAGQAEAARSIGLTFGQSLGQVIMPQAFRSVVPPLGSVIIAMQKNSAILGVFGVGGDLLSVGNRLISAQGFAVSVVFLGVWVGYLAITLPTGALLGLLERKVAIVR